MSQFARLPIRPRRLPEGSWLVSLARMTTLAAFVMMSGGSAIASDLVDLDQRADVRPQLFSSDAARHTVLTYFKAGGQVDAPVVDNWDPRRGVELPRKPPRFVVGPPGAGGTTHASVQAAISAAVSLGGADRIFVHVLPGVYREVVCVPANSPPLTLYGTRGRSKDTTVVFGNLAGTGVNETSTQNPCLEVSAQTLGTDASSTFAVLGSDFEARELTIANDGDESQLTNKQSQGVALYTVGDRLIFEKMRFVANQDTIMMKTRDPQTIARVFFRGTYVEGDVDFICGRATAVFDGGEIHSVTTRKPTGGVVLAPATHTRHPFGILIRGARFTAPSGVDGTIALGRAWDEKQVDVATYRKNVATGNYPNGSAIVRDCDIGPHIRRDDPWAPAATTARPFSATEGAGFPANRLFEYNNKGPGACVDQRARKRVARPGATVPVAPSVAPTTTAPSQALRP